MFPPNHRVMGAAWAHRGSEAVVLALRKVVPVCFGLAFLCLTIPGSLHWSITTRNSPV